MNRSEMENMKREEYYNSPQFKLIRLLNNMPSKLLFQMQDYSDWLELFQKEFGYFGDKLTLVERQLRIIHQECQQLNTFVRNLTSSIEPKKWVDWETTVPIQDNESQKDSSL